MTMNELRLVASDGEVLQSAPDLDARAIFDFLRTASAASASFHAVSHIHLVLHSEAIRSRWHAKANADLVALQKAGLTWITDVWPAATVVPQVFVNVSNRTTASAGSIESLLAAGNAGDAARVIHALAEDAGRQSRELASYREALEKAYLAAETPIAALLTGSASIRAVIADDGAKIEELLAQIAELRERIQARAEEVARRIALHKAKLEAFLGAFQYVYGAERVVKDWGKSFITMLATGMPPGLDVEAFLQDITEIMEKSAQIDELGRDVVALTNLGGTLAAIHEMKPRLDVRPFEAMLQATQERLRAIAATLRATPAADAVAAARKSIAVEAERARLLAVHCEHFQSAAVEARKPPAVVWIG